MSRSSSSGPLTGLRIVEMAGIGPAPFCGMLLADMGADVVRIDRLEASGLGIAFPPRFDMLNRNKRSIAINLKCVEGVAAVARMIDDADVVIEGFRPGVMEKLGLGPGRFEETNPRLVYGRMTGWGQEGPLATSAGHDLNYIAITGALAAIGPADGAPVVPLNLIGDFGGGTLYLAMGVLAAVIAARDSGQGQVVDAAIVDGVTSLMTMQHALRAMGEVSLDRGRNLIDGGAPFYSVYQTADDRWISIAAIEPKFYRELVDRMGLGEDSPGDQYDRAGWPAMRRRFTEAFRARSRDAWCALLEGTDACFAPVLDLDEAAAHPHNAARQNLLKVSGVVTAAPAPRFSAMPADAPFPASAAGAETAAILAEWYFSEEEISRLRSSAAIV